MKLEMIKNALKARTLALNIKPASVVEKVEEKIAPVVKEDSAPVDSVAVKSQSISNAEVVQKNDKPVESQKPEKVSTAPIQQRIKATR